MNKKNFVKLLALVLALMMALVSSLCAFAEETGDEGTGESQTTEGGNDNPTGGEGDNPTGEEDDPSGGGEDVPGGEDVHGGEDDPSGGEDTPGEGDFPFGPGGGGRPHGGGGHRPSGGGGMGGGTGTTTTVITAGKALIETHSSGQKDMTLYDTVDPETETNTLQIFLDGGEGTYSTELSETVLTLTPEGNGSQWTVGQDALGILSRSGVETLRLVLGEKVIELDTEMSFSGYLYGMLRAQGYVSSDFLIETDGNEIWIQVDQSAYGLKADGSLEPEDDL